MGGLNARLAKLEQSSPSRAGRCIVLAKYEGESNADVYAAYPEIEPGPRDLVVFVRRFGSKRGELRNDGPKVWPIVR